MLVREESEIFGIFRDKPISIETRHDAALSCR